MPEGGRRAWPAALGARKFGTLAAALVAAALLPGLLLPAEPLRQEGHGGGARGTWAGGSGGGPAVVRERDGTVFHGAAAAWAGESERNHVEQAAG